MSAAATPAETSLAAQDLGGEPLWVDAVEGDGSGTVDAVRTGRFGTLREATIMMVDDEPTTLDILQMYLEDAGYQNFVRITDSSKVLGRIAAEPPDVLLLDLMMPGLSGLEILTTLRESERERHLPVIILTSSSDADTKLKALELGATDFLAKPVDASELALRLRNTLAAKAYQDRLAYYDGPTGLPNRELFERRLEREIQRARRTGTSCAVLNIGLRRFEMLSQALGSVVTDRLLGAVGERIELRVRADETSGAGPMQTRPEATIARGAGDQFLVLISDITEASEVGHLARALIGELQRAFPIDGRELFVKASIGIVMYPTDGDSVHDLLNHAHAATSQAMQQRRDGYHFFSEELNARTLERMRIENDLHRALERGEFELYFQPKLAVDSPRLLGAEALLRWRHPEHGLVPPMRFIPVAEEAGLIIPIGSWVIHRACREARAWELAGFGRLRVAVNVSTHQLLKSDLVGTIEGALSATELEGERLVVEVTETAIMDNPTEAIACLKGIKALGVKISMDDFGTGYSSLTYLKRLPVDELKIDRAFIRDLPEVREDVAITSAIITMARGLGLNVVAEGIEKAEQLEFLRAQRCDQWQGFLFSAPLPADQFVELLRQGRPPRPAAPATATPERATPEPATPVSPTADSPTTAPALSDPETEAGVSP